MSVLLREFAPDAVLHAEDVILQALRCLPAKQPSTPHLDRSLQEVFEAVRGLADDVEFSRNPSTGRPVDLA